MATWEYDLYDDNSYSLRLFFPSKELHFSFENAVKSLMKRGAESSKITPKIRVPNKFEWYVRRQTKRMVVKPKMYMERDGAKILTMKLDYAEYDTTEKDNWVMTIFIKGTYRRDKLWNSTTPTEED